MKITLKINFKKWNWDRNDMSDVLQSQRCVFYGTLQELRKNGTFLGFFDGNLKIRVQNVRQKPLCWKPK